LFYSSKNSESWTDFVIEHNGQTYLSIDKDTGKTTIKDLNVEGSLTLSGMALVKQEELIALQQQLASTMNRLAMLEV
jgi:hypothetical protein